jgi:hypothetical protein
MSSHDPNTVSSHRQLALCDRPPPRDPSALDGESVIYSGKVLVGHAAFNVIGDFSDHSREELIYRPNAERKTIFQMVRKQFLAKATAGSRGMGLSTPTELFVVTLGSP